MPVVRHMAYHQDNPSVTNQVTELIQVALRKFCAHVKNVGPRQMSWTYRNRCVHFVFLGGGSPASGAWRVSVAHKVPNKSKNPNPNP